MSNRIPVVNSLMDYFPLPTPRPMQEKVLREVEKAYQNGAKFVILESPVGSGKSAKAITLALRYGTSHILTPRKALQDQYYEDFAEHIHLMKGRSAYPCVYTDSSNYSKILDEIESGNTPSPSITGVSVADGPCNPSNFNLYTRCNSRHECPYSVAINLALKKDHVVHNIHSFIFQAFMHGKFDKREILVVDECHNLEGVIRDFLIKEIKVRGIGLEVPESEELSDYEPFLRDPARKPRNAEGKKAYDDGVTGLMNSRMQGFVVEVEEDVLFKTTRLKFIPKKVGHAPSSFIFNFGNRVLLMSGTIYDKNSFCRSLGIKAEEAAFIRVPSTFPARNRPIVMKDEYMVDTSHREWSNNFQSMVGNIVKVMDRFPDVKGLIHAPSYRAMEEIYAALPEESRRRVVRHSREDFRQRLDEFFASDGSGVFLSPTCQEGVDFKDDRARFQMILRVPYPNAGDKLTATLMREDFPWYNRQALIVLGQQLGRINRSESDHGVTVLMDSRFKYFIQRNKKLLQSWVIDAILT